jgi:hypothetical protein
VAAELLNLGPAVDQQALFIRQHDGDDEFPGGFSRNYGICECMRTNRRLSP